MKFFKLGYRGRRALRYLLLFYSLSISVLLWYLWSSDSLMYVFDHPADRPGTNVEDLDTIAFAKPENQTALWTSFLEMMKATQPDPLSLQILDDHQSVIEVEKIDADTTPIDRARISQKGFRTSKAAHALMVARIPDYTDLVNYREGTRGIISVGGGEFMPTVLVSIRLLRKRGCVLPVEVFVPMDKDYDAYMCDVVLKELNGRCIILSRFENYHISKYQYKAFALLFSSFEEVLFLDADNLVAVNPLPFFKSEPFASTGLVTWPDLWTLTVSSLYYTLTEQSPIPLTERATTESGQILISKKRHPEVLLLAAYYNLYGPDFYYRLLSQGAPGEGDKETFLAAASVFNATFYQVHERSFVIGFVNTTGKYHGTSMVQHDPMDDWELQQQEAVGWRLPEPRKIAFVHQIGMKLNPQDLVSRLDGMRMWGSKAENMDRFGYDLEAEVWEEIIHVGCRYGPAFPGWEKPVQICDGLRRFWATIESREKIEEAQLQSWEP